MVNKANIFVLPAEMQCIFVFPYMNAEQVFVGQFPTRLVAISQSPKCIRSHRMPSWIII